MKVAESRSQAFSAQEKKKLTMWAHRCVDYLDHGSPQCICMSNHVVHFKYIQLYLSIILIIYKNVKNPYTLLGYEVM